MTKVEEILQGAYESFMQAVAEAQAQGKQTIEEAAATCKVRLAEIEAPLLKAQREFSAVSWPARRQKEDADRATRSRIAILQNQQRDQLREFGKQHEEPRAKFYQASEKRRQSKISAAAARKEAAQSVGYEIGKCDFADAIVLECDAAIAAAWKEFYADNEASDARIRAEAAPLQAEVDARCAELDVELQNELQANQAAYDDSVREALAEWTKWTDQKKQIEEDRKQVESFAVDRGLRLSNLRPIAWRTFAASVLAAADQLRVELATQLDSPQNTSDEQLC